MSVSVSKYHYDKAYEKMVEAWGALKARIPKYIIPHIGFPFKPGCDRREITNMEKKPTLPSRDEGFGDNYSRLAKKANIRDSEKVITQQVTRRI